MATIKLGDFTVDSNFLSDSNIQTSTVASANPITPSSPTMRLGDFEVPSDAFDQPQMISQGSGLVFPKNGEETPFSFRRMAISSDEDKAINRKAELESQGATASYTKMPDTGRIIINYTFPGQKTQSEFLDRPGWSPAQIGDVVKPAVYAGTGIAATFIPGAKETLAARALTQGLAAAATGTAETAADILARKRGMQMSDLSAPVVSGAIGATGELLTGAGGAMLKMAANKIGDVFSKFSQSAGKKYASELSSNDPMTVMGAFDRMSKDRRLPESIRYRASRIVAGDMTDIPLTGDESYILSQYTRDDLIKKSMDSISQETGGMAIAMKQLQKYYDAIAPQNEAVAKAANNFNVALSGIHSTAPESAKVASMALRNSIDELKALNTVERDSAYEAFSRSLNPEKTAMNATPEEVSAKTIIAKIPVFDKSPGSDASAILSLARGRQGLQGRPGEAVDELFSELLQENIPYAKSALGPSGIIGVLDHIKGSDGGAKIYAGLVRDSKINPGTKVYPTAPELIDYLVSTANKETVNAEEAVAAKNALSKIYRNALEDTAGNSTGWFSSPVDKLSDLRARRFAENMGDSSKSSIRSILSEVIDEIPANERYIAQKKAAIGLRKDVVSAIDDRMASSGLPPGLDNLTKLHEKISQNYANREALLKSIANDLADSSNITDKELNAAFSRGADVTKEIAKMISKQPNGDDILSYVLANRIKLQMDQMAAGISKLDKTGLAGKTNIESALARGETPKQGSEEIMNIISDEGGPKTKQLMEDFTKSRQMLSRLAFSKPNPAPSSASQGESQTSVVRDITKLLSSENQLKATMVLLAPIHVRLTAHDAFEYAKLRNAQDPIAYFNQMLKIASDIGVTGAKSAVYGEMAKKAREGISTIPPSETPSAMRTSVPPVAP